MSAGRSEGPTSEACGAGQRWPLFGGWLPLITIRSRPSHADGAPWDGMTDPGYRATIFVVGWLGQAVSVVIGRPRPASSLGVVASEADALIRMLDTQVSDRRGHDPERERPRR